MSDAMTTDRSNPSVAFYTGKFLLNDGIGRVLRDKIEALRARPGGQDWQITVFCESSNVEDPAVRVRRSLSQVVCDPAFLAADIHIFEFGWYYQLMDAVLFVPPAAKSIVHFQGVTPADLVTDKAGFLASWKQQLNLHKADAVLCASPYARDVLGEFGLDREKIRVLPLAASVVPAVPPVKAKSGLVNLLQVGRLVPHKGALDLVSAIAMLPDWLRDSISLEIVGSKTAANQDYLAEIEAAIAENRLHDSVRLVGSSADDRALSDLYARADAIVIPSYHEAYCLPLIEGYAHGCHVIAYDNSNLPHAAAGRGRIVATGDIAALSAAIADFVSALAGPDRADGSALIATDSGPVSWGALQQAVIAQADKHSRATFERMFLSIVDETLAAPSPSGISRLDPAVFFEDRRSFTVSPRDLSIKEPYGQPGLEVVKDGRIEYLRERFATVDETVLFYGPYVDLPPGKWRLTLDAEIEGEFTLRLTRSFGTLITEEIVSQNRLSFEFDLQDGGEKFESLLHLSPAARAISLGGMSLIRID